MKTLVGTVAGHSYRLAVGKSVNAVCRALVNDDLAAGEAEWAKRAAKYAALRPRTFRAYVIPHSHPVLTLNTRYLDDQHTAQLATFVHEQIHWFLADHMDCAKTDAALTELRVLYPTVPTELPTGARGERSTYLHLIVCTLELQALTELLGAERTAAVGALDPLYVGIPDGAHGYGADRWSVTASWGHCAGAIKRGGSFAVQSATCETSPGFVGTRRSLSSIALSETETVIFAQH